MPARQQINRVLPSARDGFQATHPGSCFDDLLRSLGHAQNIAEYVARTLAHVGRASCYLLSAEHEGLFVVKGSAVVAYHPVGRSQREFCRKLLTVR